MVNDGQNLVNVVYERPLTFKCLQYIVDRYANQLGCSNTQLLSLISTTTYLIVFMFNPFFCPFHWIGQILNKDCELFSPFLIFWYKHEMVILVTSKRIETTLVFSHKYLFFGLSDEIDVEHELFPILNLFISWEHSKKSWDSSSSTFEHHRSREILKLQ